MLIIILSLIKCSYTSNDYKIPQESFSDTENTDSEEEYLISNISKKNDNINPKNKLHIRFNNSYKWTQKFINNLNIKEININNDGFEYIPENIKYHKNLRIIDINSDQFISFSDEVGKLPYLKKLIVGNLTINKLDRRIKNLLNLRVLIIGNDKN